MRENGFVSLISTTGSGLLLLLLRSPSSPAAVYCIMGSYYVMSPPCCAGRHGVLIVKTIAFLAAGRQPAATVTVVVRQ